MHTIYQPYFHFVGVGCRQAVTSHLHLCKSVRTNGIQRKNNFACLENMEMEVCIICTMKVFFFIHTNPEILCFGLFTGKSILWLLNKSLVQSILQFSKLVVYLISAAGLKSYLLVQETLP